MTSHLLILCNYTLPNGCLQPTNQPHSTLIFTAGQQIDFPTDGLDNNQMLGLLVAGKLGATEISKMMFHAPGVNFALVSSIFYGGHHIHAVSIRVNSSKLQNLWQWVLVKENSSLLAKGLLAMVMQSGTFVWLRGKPMSG